MNRRKWRRHEDEHGAALVVAMAALMVSSIILASMAVVVIYTSRIVRLQTAHEQAYWLARGVAAQVLRQLRNGDMPPAQSEEVFDAGTVNVSVVQGRPLSLRIVAHTMDAAECISFRYDTIQHKLVDWKENLPVSSSTDSS